MRKTFRNLCTSKGHHAPDKIKNKMNTFIIENKFTGYRAEITTKGDAPALSTVKKHFRKAKASDCRSETTVREKETGDRYVIANTGHGEEVVAVGY